MRVLRCQSLLRGTVSSRMPSLVTMQILSVSPVYTSLSAAEMKTSFTSRMALSKVSGTCSTFCMFLKPTWEAGDTGEASPDSLQASRAPKPQVSESPGGAQRPPTRACGDRALAPKKHTLWGGRHRWVGIAADCAVAEEEEGPGGSRWP